VESLLEKTRKINQLLQQRNTFGEQGTDLPYDNMAIELGDIMECNTYILNTDGLLLGYHTKSDIASQRMHDYIQERQFPVEYTDEVLRLRRTEANIPMDNFLSGFPKEMIEKYPNGLTTIVPIFGAGSRLGTFVLAREEGVFDADDLVLAEYSATVVGMQLLYQQSKIREEQARKDTAVNMAMNTLSYSELKAVKAILGALDGLEGRLTASQIADEIGITRSVIVNALRKLQSSGIIESRSLGMKGTYIKIINEGILDELKKQSI
jgi:transcriptional pleiotropic repressor